MFSYLPLHHQQCLLKGCGDYFTECGLNLGLILLPLQPEKDKANSNNQHCERKGGFSCKGFVGEIGQEVAKTDCGVHQECCSANEDTNTQKEEIQDGENPFLAQCAINDQEVDHSARKSHPAADIEPERIIFSSVFRSSGLVVEPECDCQIQSAQKRGKNSARILGVSECFTQVHTEIPSGNSDWQEQK